MAASACSPKNLEESLIWYAITGTWIVYLFGGLYVLAPALGWILMLWAGFKAYVADARTRPAERVSIPFGVWIWIIGMIVMFVALIAGHVGNDLGLAKTIKSSIGWAKGWALMAIFPAAGAMLQIRPAILYRASCRLGRQTLFLLPFLLLAPLISLPSTLFVSPLQFVGGPGPNFFEVQLYGEHVGSGAPRWRFFAPWAPAAGFVANIYLIFAFYERDRYWRTIGILAAVAMCLMAQSRLALVAMIVVPLALFGLSRLTRVWIHIAGAATVAGLGLIAPWLIELADTAQVEFTARRAASSRVRAALGRIAYERWKNEAPIWGHGIVENGSHIVEKMAIGSHHSWFGLLFVKGIVGFLALLIPMAWSFLEMLAKAQSNRTARVGLAVVLILFLYTFGENLEVLVYLFWPALIIIGRAMREPFKSPLRHPLAGRTVIQPQQ